MRNPEYVLKSLKNKSEDANYKYDRLYRNLYNVKFFLKAYGNIYAKEGNMTEGIDSKTIDGMSIKRIEKLIEKLKDEKYVPNPVKRTYIPKKNGKKRPLGIPSIDDKLVQEVIRMILNEIYENSFSTNSHSFRENRSCHTALKQIKCHYDGARWFVEGDIESFFDNIDHHKLIEILKEKIKDEKFIRLIWKFLRAGYLEQWVYHKTYSGTPQGGILSPLLANIYLDKLDKFIEKYTEKFNKGIKRKLNNDYINITNKINRRRKKLASASNDDINRLKVEISELRKKRNEIPSIIVNDETYKRMFYTRYADDFLIGVIGSKQDAVNIKNDLRNFLAEELKLNLSDEKTLITNTEKPARFLGYDIRVSRSQDIKKCDDGIVKRTHSYTCKLYVPNDVWVKKLKDLKILRITKDGTWKQNHRANLINMDDLEILNIYNSQIRGLYNYYRLANNVSVLNKFYYHMKYSMYKTYANKYKSTINKITNRFCRNGVFQIEYETKKGSKSRMFYNDGFKINPKVNVTKDLDNLPNEQKNRGETSLIDRLKARKCEWCESENKDIEIHHVRKLKDLKGKKEWEKEMIGRKRKTLALCHECHWKLHNGKLD